MRLSPLLLVGAFLVACSAPPASPVHDDADTAIIRADTTSMDRPIVVDTLPGVPIDTARTRP